MLLGIVLAAGACHFLIFKFFVMNIFATKLSYDTTSEELQEVFEAYGEVSSAKVITDRDTGRSKGYGFVEMDDDSEANAAIDALNETELDGRTIIVKEAKPREERRPAKNFSQW